MRALLTVVGVWLIGCAAIALVIVVYGETERAEPADVIVVLGAGLRRNGEPGPALTRRVNHAAAVFEQGYAPAIICTGGYPQRGIQRSEADACRALLLAQGIPESAVFLEEQSRSTEENAVYTQAIMEENGWQSALVVSDGYHLLRAELIFSQVGIAHTTSPTVSPPFFTYVSSVAREVVALHWQAVKTILNLPYTYVPWL